MLQNLSDVMPAVTNKLRPLYQLDSAGSGGITPLTSPSLARDWLYIMAFDYLLCSNFSYNFFVLYLKVDAPFIDECVNVISCGISDYSESHSCYAYLVEFSRRIFY